MLKVFIGYDPKETVAYHVLSHSILSRASVPVAIIPLRLDSLRHIFTRENVGTTEFSLTRFLIPYLSGYEGVSIFMDCDMLCLVDINSVVDGIFSENGKAVYVCKHDYVPKEGLKATGVQTSYPKKNWSSFMLFDNEKCKALTPEYVNSSSAMELHRLMWIAEEEVGSLDLRWNWLVGEYNKCPDPKVLHYTLGAPCFNGYEHCDHAMEWHIERKKMDWPIL